MFTAHELIENLVPLIFRPRCHLQMQRAPMGRATVNPATSLAPNYQEGADYLGPFF